MSLENENVATRKSDRWGTDRSLVQTLVKEFGPISCDLAAERSTAVVSEYLGPDHHLVFRRDALTVPWPLHGPLFLNPPFSLLPEFMAKVAVEKKRGCLILAVLPVKTEQPWWFDLPSYADEIRFLKGRLRYIDPETTLLGDSARFASCLVIADGRRPEVQGGPRVSWWDWKKKRSRADGAAAGLHHAGGVAA